MSFRDFPEKVFAQVVVLRFVASGAIVVGMTGGGTRAQVIMTS